MDTKWFRRLFLRDRIPAWIVVTGLPLAKAGWWCIEKLGDLQTIASISGWIKPRLPMMLELFWSYGWVVMMPIGFAWLAWLDRRQSQDGPGREIGSPGEAQTAVPSIPSMEIVPNFLALKQRWPADTVFHRRGDKTFGYWFTGHTVLSGLDINSHNIELVILPDPENDESIEQWQNALNLPYDLATRIYEATERAREANVKVLWHTRPFIGMAMTFLNPMRNDGWLHLDPLVFRQKKDERPFLHMEKESDPERFAVMWETFNKIKQDCRAPDLPSVKSAEGRETIRRLQEVYGDGRAPSLLLRFTTGALFAALDSQSSAGAYLITFLRSEKVEPCKRAAQEWQQVRAGDGYVRGLRSFFRMWRAAQELEVAVEECRKILGMEELTHLDGFMEWLAARTEFNMALDTVLRRDDLYPLKGWISNYRMDNPPISFEVTP